MMLIIMMMWVIVIVVVVVVSATLLYQISKLSSTMCSLTMTFELKCVKFCAYISENIL